MLLVVVPAFSYGKQISNTRDPPGSLSLCSVEPLGHAGHELQIQCVGPPKRFITQQKESHGGSLLSTQEGRSSLQRRTGPVISLLLKN